VPSGVRPVSDPRTRPLGRARTAVPADSSSSVNRCLGACLRGADPVSDRAAEAAWPSETVWRAIALAEGAAENAKMATSREIVQRMDDTHRHVPPVS
jgi:hypothetical protein